MARAPQICGDPECSRIIPQGTRKCAVHRQTWGQQTESSKRCGTRAWRVQRAKALQRDDHRCVIRGPRCTVHATQVDHVIPVSAGGTDDLSNLQSVCANDHNAKTQREARGEQPIQRGSQRPSTAPSQVPRVIQTHA